MTTKSRKLTVSDVRRLATRLGGRVVSDGCGGYEVLAPPGRRWVDAEVQCYVLPLNEFESAEETQDEIRRCLDHIGSGHEPYRTP